MKEAEIAILKRGGAIQPLPCDFCGSAKDGADFLVIDITDEDGIKNNGEMYRPEEAIVACVSHGCADRLVRALKELLPQLSPAPDAFQ